MRAVWLVAAALVAGACGGGRPPCATTPFTTESGLRMHDLVCGDGVPAGTGDLVEIELSGSLDTGRRLRGARSFRFTIGSGQVIAGLEQGVAGMRVGGRRVLVVPPELAFGRGGLRGEVPGGATLELMVELLDLVEAEA